jgi:hypothetical protein
MKWSIFALESVLSLTLALFSVGQAAAAGAASSLDIPVEDFGSLWTRDKGAGTLVTESAGASGSIASIEPRWSGSGLAEVTLRGMLLERKEGVSPTALTPTLSMRNGLLEATLSTADGTLSVRDLRCGRSWMERPLASDWFIVGASGGPGRIELKLAETRGGGELDAAFALDSDRAEIEVSVDFRGAMQRELAFPQAFVTEKGSRLVIPLNEGISYPVDDPSIGETELVAYGGHGICMGFWGVMDDQGRGQMAIIETPDDAAIGLRRSDALLYVQPIWQAQKGEFGYQRRLRYVFLDSGGFVAMCKRYRAYAKEEGELVTLAEKRSRNPKVDLLAGAADVWCWDKSPTKIVTSLKALGIDKILWSNAASPADIAAMNASGVLTGRYDIYQDCMDPGQYLKLRYVSQDWTSAGWPNDIVISRDGSWERGWGVEAKDGSLVPCGVLNDELALGYARARIPADLAEHPYGARFIDTTTASPWREDYSPAHPMTRSQSRGAKMKLLDFVSNGQGLVTGSETGHDAAVPYVHYFEGMMSLGPYRVKDAGRDMQRILETAPPQIVDFQLGWKYRLPLWELVYHDCVVAYWYWGDYSNKIPSVWKTRDLFNCLYGTPPVYMFDSSALERDAARFAESYRIASGTSRLTAYSEMVDFQILSEDRSVQRSVFADGTRATVNFGLSPWRDEKGATVAAGGYLLEGRIR